MTELTVASTSEPLLYDVTCEVQSVAKDTFNAWVKLRDTIFSGDLITFKRPKEWRIMPGDKVRLRIAVEMIP